MTALKKDLRNLYGYNPRNKKKRSRNYNPERVAVSQKRSK